MAQTKRKRSRKRRGTQSGRIDSRGGRGRPRSRAEARSQARKRADARRDQTPTWGRAITRGAVGALIFFVLMVALFRYPLGSAIGLSAAMLALYIPLGYHLDRFFWRRRRQAERRRRQQQGQ